jgi:hypothetical protein
MGVCLVGFFLGGGYLSLAWWCHLRAFLAFDIEIVDYSHGLLLFSVAVWGHA